MIQHVFFAGGGTGGHIYPALAVAQQLKKLKPSIGITFFCSDRKIDSDILSKTPFDFIPLSAVGFSANPVQAGRFLIETFKSYRRARSVISQKLPAAVVGVGGFVSTGPVLAARKLGIKTCMINTDSVPGKANKFLARYAGEVYVQFESTRKYFGSRGDKVIVTGCPLRESFMHPDRGRVFKELSLDPAKRVLLVTGASTGAKSINDAIVALLGQLSEFASGWQIVHLTGRGQFEEVRAAYADAQIAHKLLDYYDEMADLLACADLVIGRAGAVSVAEYAAAAVPAVCLPYPYHKDNHQKTNAIELEKAGCAILLDDKISPESNAENLWPILGKLLADPAALTQMRQKAQSFGINNAAQIIASRILA
jgi:UDP-N-acetylglucosamine--N-acetylmuramyl-(pentapeptide) pyrophosphoryl-undecaprenol N-acetylglucosamine transferase